MLRTVETTDLPEDFFAVSEVFFFHRRGRRATPRETPPRPFATMRFFNFRLAAAQRKVSNVIQYLTHPDQHHPPEREAPLPSRTSDQSMKRLLKKTQAPMKHRIPTVRNFD